MPTPVRMPQLGETVVEGTILKWLKAEGERIEEDEPLFEISTDKVDTEVPSPASGTLARILVGEGETVAVGTELARIEAGEGAAADEKPAAEREAESEATVEEAEAPAAGAEPRSDVLSPLVRRLAKEHNLDLGRIRGTGAAGRITKKDVLEHAAGSGTAAPVTPSTEREAAAEEVMPVSHIRKAIATHMVDSLRTSARAWNMVEIDMERVALLRERAKAAFLKREGFKLTYMPFVARAATEALLAHPMVNSELRGEEILVRRFVNLGIAVSYDEGLIVPVIKGAESLSLVETARAIDDLAVRARAKRLEPDEVHGGTFSITNPGPFGSIMSVPIINQPQTGILAFDSVVKRPVVVGDKIAIRHMVYMSMSWDHRAIDGALASQFLSSVKEYLETTDFAADPELQ